MTKPSTANSLDKEFQKEYWEQNTNARGYDHPVVRFFAQQRLAFLQEHVDLASVRNAFDVGCGDGFSAYYLNQIVGRVEGGDISSLMLKNNPLPADRLRVIDAEELPLEDDSFDLVYTWEVLHHVPNPQRVVQEMARVSRKWVVIFEPNRSNVLQFLFGALVKEERGTLRSTKSFLRGLCEQAGLDIVTEQYCGKIPPNKTPAFMMPVLRRMPFRGNFLTGISIAVVARVP